MFNVARVSKEFFLNTLSQYGVPLFGDIVEWLNEVDGDLIMAQSPMMPRVVYVTDGGVRRMFKLMVGEDGIFSKEINDDFVRSAIISSFFYF